MTFAGLVKRAKSHFENCNDGPEETPVQGDSSTFWPRGRRALRARRPRGPNVKISPDMFRLFRENDYLQGNPVHGIVIKQMATILILLSGCIWPMLNKENTHVKTSVRVFPLAIISSD